MSTIEQIESRSPWARHTYCVASLPQRHGAIMQFLPIPQWRCAILTIYPAAVCSMIKIVWESGRTAIRVYRGILIGTSRMPSSVEQTLF